MWAHAEYIKLLRSARDHQVFDLIPPVAQRYRENKGRKDWEGWKATRRVRQMAAGNVLRVLLAGDFRLRWSLDGGQTYNESLSTPSGLGLGFVDIPTHPEQSGAVQFTFVETQSEELLKKTFEVKVSSPAKSGVKARV